MITKIIGVGAAGNKAAISATEEAIVTLGDVLLVNSTLKDIPKDYEGKSYCFSDAYGGCGKERSIAKDLVLHSLQDGTLNLEEFLQVGTDKQAELVVLVSSTEGGTGSGSVPTLAKYIHDVCGIEVHCFAFTGFEEDGRGLRNTVEYFQEMEEGFAVECLCNNKFLDDCSGNKIKAEKAANTAFCKKVSILMGNPLRDSDHNIDQTDLLKIATQPGYMVIEYREFKKIKNKTEFRTMVEAMIDESKALDLNDPSQAKLGVIINIDKDNTDIIDYQDILVERFGQFYEKFEHIQHEKDMPEFIAFISAGSKIPVDEIEEIYEKYKTYSGRVTKSHDDFFSKAKDMEFDAQDDMFNLNGQKKETVDRSAFFKSMNSSSTSNNNGRSNTGQVKKSGFTNTVVKMKSEKEDVGGAY